MQSFTLKLPRVTDNSEICIGSNLWENELFWEKIQKLGKRFALLTDSNVEKACGKKFLKKMQEKGLEVHFFSFPSGEEHKNRKTKDQIEDEMQKARLGRDSVLIALGGGVVTDLAGFVAATYSRGIPLVSIPTTLLGMVDASIGGKNGVNTPKGKNLIGTYYQPRYIFMDVDLLASLPQEEMTNGMAEVIKYGLIENPKLFHAVKDQNKNLTEIVTLSAHVKCKVVEEDTHEKGLRRILNFGHTIGHALEAVEGYQMSHGNAVAIGMAVESFISKELGYLPTKDFEEILHVIRKVPFRLQVSSKATFSKMLEAMAVDKKALKANPRFVLLKTIGQVVLFEGEYCMHIDNETLQKAIDWMQQEFGA